MGWFSAFAIFFIIWWTALFAVLPFSLRTQDEAGELVPGTEASAPRGKHMLRACVRTTVVSIAVFAALYILTRVFHFSLDDLPHLVPDFGMTPRGG